jgi:hypothetical protein
MKIEDLELVATCCACPEQYDVYCDSKVVGYIRLRHGVFRVDCPDCGGTIVLCENVESDGVFGSEEERKLELTKAKEAIVNYHNNLKGEE